MEKYILLLLVIVAKNWLIASDEPTSRETFVEYGLRFDIEEGFKDDKSGVFQLESSKFRDAQALTRAIYS